MKTPQRNQGNGYEADCFPFDGPNQTAFEHARWKRKNREAQLRRTISKLTRMLKNTEQCLLATQKMTGFGCIRPAHWPNVFATQETEAKKNQKTLRRLLRKIKTTPKEP